MSLPKGLASVVAKAPTDIVILSSLRTPICRSYRGQLKDAWAFSTINPERTRALGDAIERTGAVPLAVERMNVEIHAALEALGPYAHQGMGPELVSWARRLSEGIAAQAEARSRAA